MKTRRVYKKYLAFLARMGILTCLLQAVSFSPAINSLVTADEEKPPDPEFIALGIANQAIQNGDFKKALEGYEVLQHSSHDKIARKALYGLACAKLSLAKNSKDVREALIIWDAWSKHAPADLEDEDPRLLGPLLKSKIPPKPNKIRARPVVIPDEKLMLEKVLRAKEKEIRQLNDKLKAMENEIQTMLKNQADYVGVLEKQIQTLRDKIKSVEAIDQKIEEKKKEVSSP
ncbi:MAG: hypothetical protein B1H12_05895 [Desulfobacteraceae bacterium 4484_190.2]|nr:MAG: hypothetical protein B1H12_05895 [Desulfobacteraceae bacterium 4484_190.2]